jgi:hypothetical protein
MRYTADCADEAHAGIWNIAIHANHSLPLDLVNAIITHRLDNVLTFGKVLLLGRITHDPSVMTSL